MLFSPEEHARISAAIADAETRTSGEIFAIVATAPVRYRATSLVVAAFVAAVLPPLLALGGFDPAALLSIGDGGWRSGNAAAPGLAAELVAYSGVQLALFLLVAVLVAFTPLERALTPRRVKAAHARDRAVEQFLAKGLHVTAARTGVLLYVALPDHQVEVVADEGIYAKVAPAVWGDTAAALVDGLREGRAADGFVTAIGLAGAVLAEHFPPGPRNPNELADHLVEL